MQVHKRHDSCNFRVFMLNLKNFCVGWNLKYKQQTYLKADDNVYVQCIPLWNNLRIKLRFFHNRVLHISILRFLSLAVQLMEFEVKPLK